MPLFAQRPKSHFSGDWDDGSRRSKWGYPKLIDLFGVRYCHWLRMFYAEEWNTCETMLSEREREREKGDRRCGSSSLPSGRDKKADGAGRPHSLLGKKR